MTFDFNKEETEEDSNQTEQMSVHSNIEDGEGSPYTITEENNPID